MASFTNTVEIRRPREVSAFLADLENVPKWNYAISETRKTSPADVAAGTTYEQTRSNPLATRETPAITEFKPDRHRTVEGTLTRFPVRPDYVVRDLDGRTEGPQHGRHRAQGCRQDLERRRAAGSVLPLLRTSRCSRQLLESGPRG
jgi:hypothetical protein